jgi:hypothetical protein
MNKLFYGLKSSHFVRREPRIKAERRTARILKRCGRPILAAELRSLQGDEYRQGLGDEMNNELCR